MLGLFAAHALANELFCLLVNVLAHLFREIAVEIAAAEKIREPAHSFLLRAQCLHGID